MASLPPGSIQRFKDQMLIALVKRLGGELDIPASEVDDTGRDILTFEIIGENVFHFEVRKKS